MSFVSDQQLEEIRSRADVVQVVGEKVPLKRAGRNFKGLCPFHNEKSPSFMVHPEKQIFHCFGCGEGGDVFSFLMKYDGLDFAGAVEALAERYGIVLHKVGESHGAGEKIRAEKDLLLRINRLAIRFFHDNLLSPSGRRGREYLEKRGIRQEVWKEAYLGYAPGDGKSLTRLLKDKKVPLEMARKLGLVRRGQDGDDFDFFRDRLVFSVVSPEKKFLGFSGRALEDGVQPKYLNSPESPIYHKSDTLLGIHLARPAIREKEQVILVEGNFDLLRLHQEGIRNIVAPLGTSLTERQVRYLRRFTESFVLLFDGDAAGLKASERALETFLPLGLSPRIVLLPQGEDPDSYVLKNGTASLEKMISLAPSLLDVRIEHILKKEGADSQGKVRAVRQIAELLSKLPGEMEKRVYIQGVADRFGLTPEGILEAFRRKKEVLRKESNFSVPSGDHEDKKFPPIEKTILEVLLSGHANPAVLFEEIGPDDFSHPVLAEIWTVVKQGFQRDGQLDLARILSHLEEERLKKALSELAFAGGRWQDDGGKAAADCLRQLRVMRLRAKLKDLSNAIRVAERENNLGRMKDLMDQKNQLIKEMTSFH